MKQIVVRQGKATLEDVPVPQVKSGTVLVAIEYSCISVGTETSGVKDSGVPIWQRAMQQPQKVKQVLELVQSQGLKRTRRMVEGRVSAGYPTGYSVAGRVLEVGEGVEGLKGGDRVACGGAQWAHHAEVVRIPQNMAVRVPEGVMAAEASTTTMGAIAMQGVRRAEPTLGEWFVVVGLGFLGQLTVQMLKANGCRVIATDIDSHRLVIAEKHGADFTLGVSDNDQVDKILKLTDGFGADGVIVTAASKSDAIMHQAFSMCRKKGRVVLVGDVGMNLDRSDMYMKELDFFISTSYGPGRYDRNYEEDGLDYPIGYVRWTENRNMSEYLRLISDKILNLEPLIEKIYPLSEVESAYSELQADGVKPLAALFSYPGVSQDDMRTRLDNPGYTANSAQDVLRVGVIGAGGYAQAMLMPLMKELDKEYEIKAVSSSTGHNAAETARQFNSAYSVTDHKRILADENIDAVFITTRHNLHAKLAIEALSAGKHVWLEKPLALTREECDQLTDHFNAHTENRLLLTGFNRRFSPAMLALKKTLSNRTSPLIINYRMNAGYIPMDSWVHGTEGGGRNRGEACHIYDLFTALTDSQYCDVHVSTINPASEHYSARDNFVVTVTFEDGSVGTLIYTALGHADYPKEQMEVFADGKVFTMNDYKELSVYGANQGEIWCSKRQDKGQENALKAFSTAISQSGEWPVPWWQQLQATEIAIRVEELMNQGSL